MKINALPFVYVALAYAPGWAQISPATPPPAPAAPAASPAAPIPPDAVVAEVDGQKITYAQAEKLMALFPPQMQAATRNDPKRALGYIIMLKHLAAEAEKAKLDKESPLKETLEYNRIAALSQAEINQIHNVDVKVETEDEKKFYKENPDRFKEAKVKVIYVSFSATPTVKQDGATKKLRTEAEAKTLIEDLRKQIDGGADFAKLARENSDDKESVAKDGDFGIIKRSSSYPDPIKNAVFALKAGQVSEPVRQPNGFYLLKLESSTQQPYDAVRAQISEELKQKGFSDVMAALQKRYDVKVENPAYFAPKTTGPPAPPAH